MTENVLQKMNFFIEFIKKEKKKNSKCVMKVEYDQIKPYIGTQNLFHGSNLNSKKMKRLSETDMLARGGGDV